jgi:hypothetical protein
LLLLVSPLAGEPPADLARRVAAREAENEKARSNYAYRQTVEIQEMQPRGGKYREVREVIFSPSGERTERAVGKPQEGLQRLKLTPEDFEDIRNIQPVLLTTETLARYEVKFRGDEIVDGADCWVLEVRPRQIFQGQRYFEGTLWALKSTSDVVRLNGQAVPPIYSKGSENLFPRFTTLRTLIDGKFWFPARTWADDTLPFRSGPLRIRFDIRYEQYQRFGAESTITFEPPK